MTKNPLLNALAALAYIVAVAAVMFYGGKRGSPDNSFMVPVALISLFTLSAAVMGYLFCFKPAQLYFDGQKKEGMNLFLQTVAIFGLITAVLLALLFTGVFSSKKQAVPAAVTPKNGQSSPSEKSGQNPAGLANPAATYCVEQGGKSTIVTAADGSQSGVCIFPGGRKCDEWSFFRTKACE